MDYWGGGGGAKGYVGPPSKIIGGGGGLAPLAPLFLRQCKVSTIVTAIQEFIFIALRARDIFTDD